MDKGKAIKIGIAVVLLVAAAFLIYRSMGGGGGAETPVDPGATEAPSLGDR